MQERAGLAGRTAMFPPDYVRAASARATEADRRLHLLVLEGGHALLARARAALARGDAVAFAADVERTQESLRELVSRLERDDGGAMVDRVTALQHALLGQMALASAARSLSRVDEVLAAFGPVVEAYRELARRVAGTP
jgi:flagellin-specific chaperone FliS